MREEGHRDRPGDDPGPIARRLNELIEFAEKRDGRGWSNADIAEASTDCGFPLTAAAVSHIRRGRVKTPGFRVIEGIAAALGVDVREFLVARSGQEPLVDAEFAQELRDAGVDTLGFRFSELGRLSPHGKEVFRSVTREVLRTLREQEKGEST